MATPGGDCGRHGHQSPQWVPAAVGSHPVGPPVVLLAANVGASAGGLAPLANSAHGELGAALRRRAKRDGLPILIHTVRPDYYYLVNGAPRGLVQVQCLGDDITDSDVVAVAGWLRANVAPAVLDKLGVRVCGTDSWYRVFGSLGGYLASAFDGSYYQADLPEADPDSGGDWAYWRTTITPESAAAVEAAVAQHPATVAYLRDSACGPEDLLDVLVALHAAPTRGQA